VQEIAEVINGTYVLDDCAYFLYPLRRRSWTTSASYECKNKSARRDAHLIPKWIPTVCWKTPPPNSINEKVDHIDDVDLGVLRLASNLILNKIRIKSMNHNMWELSLVSLGPQYVRIVTCQPWTKRNLWNGLWEVT